MERICKRGRELVDRRRRSHCVPYSVLFGHGDAAGATLRRISAKRGGLGIGFRAKNVREAQGSPRVVESACVVAAIVGALWLALGTRRADNHDMFYVFFLPVIWIAVRRGLRGAATGILLWDIGIVLSL
jgi:hypothetical protein